MILCIRYVTIILTITVLLTFYLTTLTLFNVKKTVFLDNHNRRIKNIIAYSLRKQIEIESQEILCDPFVEDAFSEKVASENNLGGENFERVWEQVPDSGFYVYSVYLDKRLHPYNYIRIIGMVEGRFAFFILI